MFVQVGTYLQHLLCGSLSPLGADSVPPLFHSIRPPEVQAPPIWNKEMKPYAEATFALWDHSEVPLEIHVTEGGAWDSS